MNGIQVKKIFISVTPLSEVITKELIRFGKTASPMRSIPLGCKNSMLNHVLSFRRQVYMFLTTTEGSLEISFPC